MFGSNVNSLGKTEKNQKVKEGECVFPFKYKRETHSKCYPTEKGDICATSINEKGTLKTYGYCRKNKTLKKKKKLKIIDESSLGSKTMSSVVVDTPYNDAFISLLGKLEKLMIIQA